MRARRGGGTRLENESGGRIDVGVKMLSACERCSSAEVPRRFKMANAGLFLVIILRLTACTEGDLASERKASVIGFRSSCPSADNRGWARGSTPLQYIYGL